MVKYSQEALIKIAQRDDAFLLDDYDKIQVYTLVFFICSCGSCDCKKFRTIYDKSGLLCNKCAYIRGQIKSKTTNLEKFGVENPFGSKIIQERIRNKNLEKYGVEYVSQSKEIIEKVKKSNIEKYGVTCSLQRKDVKTKARNTIMEKYGVDNISQSKEIKEQKKKTLLLNYGVEHMQQSSVIQQRSKETIRKVYGVENVFQNEDIKQKSKETIIKNYGVLNCMQSPIIRERVQNTNLLKYGFRSPMQNAEIYEKAMHNAHRYKRIQMPSGKERIIMGYEEFAIKDLLLFYNEEQIITDRHSVPLIKYIFEGKKHYYSPDIYIPHMNEIYEVKSTRTYDVHLEKNHAKALACIGVGYIFEFDIYDGKGNLDEVIQY